MNLAAMIDLGIEPDYLKSELDKLGLSADFDLIISDGVRNGITGTRVDVKLNNKNHFHEHSDHHHDHDHNHDHLHPHAHDHPHEEAETEAVAGHSHGHHRNLGNIEKIILGSELAKEVKDTSLKIFHRIAEAEAHVHGKSIDEVHFHEVGAIDSIVDIVGAAICFHRLGVDAVWASSIELGSGFVNCAHGIIPVPAPATVEILHNIPTKRGGSKHEATTPTGAAIIASLVDKFIDDPAMTTNKTGYGIGHRETGIPNVLRVQLAM